ncbi:LuxR family transcriptional regulator [Enterovibrio norvegicus FF-33]|uniref:LuxR family transcriptional regulator n=1 Tax=Enterovibrio norvegicus FF-454 TaxID=1185651 RepID=A0A1E5BX70_9GAMM|nr:TetR/AcrR family transcriptional regulator [Enterovibrio norvegicus]OEE57883.1 LuxR family transcriptional regulator [Enterovibrio norvegicus FF-454]OEE70521.1 LuxR family transcriptional regulator [Enterovibrio norvegicus FF-33]OEE82701.1 LuxR family transcriptional regulator [Enterovibrio norvegicus FF-162]
MATSSGRTRTRLSPEQRKEQLLGYALEVFSKRGIGRAGHADIADMANVSVATVFNYFSTREELVDVVLNQAEKEFQQLISHNIKLGNGDAHASLSHVASALINAALDDKEWLKVWFEWSTSIREDIWPNFVNGKNVVLEQYASLFEQGIASKTLPANREPMEMARMFDGVCYILYLQAHQQPDKDALTRQAEGYIDMLCSK